MQRLKKPVEEQVNRYIDEKGTGVLEFSTADGRPLETVVRRVILQSKARARWDYMDNLSDGDNKTDDEFDFLSNRVNLGIGFEFTEQVSAMVDLRALFIGGGATSERVSAAFKLILSNENVKAILVNIFGGIVRCDLIAQGIVSAVKEVGVSVPVVVRLEGTNVQKGRKLLADSKLDIIAASDLTDAAKKAVASAR